MWILHEYSSPIIFVVIKVYHNDHCFFFLFAFIYCIVLLVVKVLKYTKLLDFKRRDIVMILMLRTGLVEIDEPSIACKRDTDKTSPNLNYRIESRLMDAISLSAKTTRCANKWKVDRRNQVVERIPLNQKKNFLRPTFTQIHAQTHTRTNNIH